MLLLEMNGVLRVGKGIQKSLSLLGSKTTYSPFLGVVAGETNTLWVVVHNQTGFCKYLDHIFPWKG